MKAGTRAASTALAAAREQNTTMQHEKTACHLVGFTTSKAGVVACRMRRTRLNELKNEGEVNSRLRAALKMRFFASNGGAAPPFDGHGGIVQT